MTFQINLKKNIDILKNVEFIQKYLNIFFYIKHVT